MWIFQLINTAATGGGSNSIIIYPICKKYPVNASQAWLVQSRVGYVPANHQQGVKIKKYLELKETHKDHQVCPAQSKITPEVLRNSALALLPGSRRTIRSFPQLFLPKERFSSTKVTIKTLWWMKGFSVSFIAKRIFYPVIYYRKTPILFCGWKLRDKNHQQVRALLMGLLSQRHPKSRAQWWAKAELCSVCEEWTAMLRF